MKEVAAPPAKMIEPAATLADAQKALATHQPRILLFSGHTLMGSLAFRILRIEPIYNIYTTPKEISSSERVVS